MEWTLDWIGWFFDAVARRAPTSIQVESTRYLAGAVGTWLVVWVLLGAALSARKIRKPTKRGPQIRRELLYSGSTVLVFMQRAGVVNARRRFPDVPLEKIEALFEYLIPVSNTGRDCFPAALKTMRLLESKFLDAAALSTNETQQIRNLASRWLAAAALDHQQDRSLALGRLLWRDWKNLPNYVSETAGFFSRRANAVIRQEGLRSCT